VSEENKAKKDAGEVKIKLKWGAAGSLPTLYANQLYITHAGGEFYLVFGEAAPLFEVDQTEFPESMEVTPVAKIALTPSTMEAVAKAIQGNVKKYLDRLEEKE